MEVYTDTKEVIVMRGAEFNPKILNPNDYTPVGDIMVLALCIVMSVVLFINRMRKGSSYRIMAAMIITIYFASVTSILYRMAMFADVIDPLLVYVTRIANHTFLSFLQVTNVLYLREPLWMKTDGYKRFIAVITVIAAAPIIIDIIGIVFRFGFYIDGSVIHSDFTIYPISYSAFELIMFYLIIRYRNRIIKQVFICLIAVNALSLILTAVQGMFNQASFTTFVHIIPAVGLLFLFHGNPYDAETGAVSANLFFNELKDCIERKIPLVMIRCCINDFNNQMRHKPELRLAFNRFFKQSVKRGVLYRASDGKLLLTVRKSRKGNFDRVVSNMLDNFYLAYDEIGIDYKLIVSEIVPEITYPSDYIRFFDLIESDMKSNETHWVTDDDVKRFISTRYILTELEDITKKRDLEDERVLVYCQPVFNIVSGSYDTAEALMRLKLPDVGLVFPDKFIPIAEKYGLIHQLSLTILNKTCGVIRELIAEGYMLNRISVNFSTLDLKYENFSEEVQDIIIRNDIPFDKIAIEMTESRSDTEFNRLKTQVTELQGLGIKFYLDDFGTGYSNFERIMEIPFDIIKFDRSLLLESVKNDSSKYMVSTFASMFNDLNYSVLFEGVEDERDEEHCRGMFAKYLQGYKYSKPVPISELRKFFRKEA